MCCFTPMPLTNVLNQNPNHIVLPNAVPKSSLAKIWTYRDSVNQHPVQLGASTHMDKTVKFLGVEASLNLATNLYEGVATFETLPMASSTLTQQDWLTLLQSLFPTPAVPAAVSATPVVAPAAAPPPTEAHRKSRHEAMADKAVAAEVMPPLTAAAPSALGQQR